MAVFWNRDGGIAAPAASVRSVFEPSERDYLSNLYRDQENANLKYTISFSPVVGIGFGRPFQVIVPMVDLTKEWAFQFYMPHNNMLWLWMRMGVIGFVIFWVAIGAAIMLAAACLLILVVLLLVGAFPTWGHSRKWGYGPTGGLGLVLVILLVLVLMNVIPLRF